MHNDADLVRRAQGGDTIAMNDLLDRLTPYVGRICASIALGHGSDATQEALMVVFRALRTLRDPVTLYGWARTIAVREALRVARVESRTTPGEMSDLPAPGDPQLATDIAAVLAQLTPEHRVILVLRDMEGLDERTAAAMLDLPAGTVKSRLHRARDSFRKAWFTS